MVYRGGYSNRMKSSKPATADKVFVLSPDDAITAFCSERDARQNMAAGDVLFDSPDELKQATAEWPGTRLVHVWNSIPGVIPLKKFMDRPTALHRIWAAIQVLEPVLPSRDDTAKPEWAPSEARAGTKKAMLLSLLNRPEGATLREMMAALRWQAHSVRGCLSTLGRGGAKIHSFRRTNGDRAYSTVPATESDPEGGR